MNESILIATYLVKGMVGTSCEARIARILCNINGVLSASASFQDSTMTVVYRENEVLEHNLKCALEKGGYAIEVINTVREERIVTQGGLAASMKIEHETKKFGADKGSKAGSSSSHGKNITRVTLQVKGMSCSGCEAKIERILIKLNGVHEAKASFSSNSVDTTYDSDVVTVEAMGVALAKAGYTLGQAEGGAPKKALTDPQGKKRLRVDQMIGLVILLVAVYFLVDKTIGFNFIPEVSASTGYGMLFVVGLLTSIHCVAMCGGINMSQCVNPAAQSGDKPSAKVMPSLLYNAGRVISYTIVGGIVGAIGSVISFSGWARGVVAVLSGIFMVVMGVSMLGIFPWINKIIPRMPRFLQAKAGNARKGRGPFIVGLLNGLMPCGPLQAMQIYALGTGSFLTGALSMFLFSLGTVPLMFGLGALSSLLSSKFTSRMMKVSAALVLLLGLVMVNRGLALSGVNFIPSFEAKPQAAVGSGNSTANGVTIKDGVQYITSKVTSGRYPQITVQAGMPVKWNLQAGPKDLNGCNRSIIIPAYNLNIDLKAGDNIIEFTPDKEGTIPYSCWMGMITSRINVVAPGSTTPLGADNSVTDSTGGSGTTSLAGGGCCSSASLAPEFANGNIPTDEIAMPKVEDGVQVVTITVGDQGYSPAVAVVQKGMKTKIRFVSEKLNPCNSTVVFPEYNGGLDLSAGQLETPVLTPDLDFTFECSMGMLHGYVKVVDDINNVDVEKIKEEISQYKPATTGGCCG